MKRPGDSGRAGGKVIGAVVGLVIIGMAAGVLAMQERAPRAGPSRSSYISVNEEDFSTVFARMSAAKAEIMKRQMDLLAARYDLGDRPASGVTMSQRKPIGP